MIPRSARMEADIPEASGAAVEGSPSMVTLHYLRREAARRWRTAVVGAVLGLLASAGFLFMAPMPDQGTVTLLLSHESGTDPAVAMATDISLLRTRVVAATVVDELDLPMSPDDFQRSVQVVPETPNVLVLTISAGDTEQARVWAGVLADEYLQFRRDQMMSRARATVAGYKDRISTLEDRVAVLTAEYDRLTSAGPVSSAEASAVLTERSQRNAEILRLQQLVEDTMLNVSALVSSSHVLDPAWAVPSSTTRRTVLVLASGLIVGTCVALGVVVFMSLTTDRLRRREDVAIALGVPVRASMRRRGPPDPAAQALERLILDQGRGPAQLALVATDEGPQVAAVVRATLARLDAAGCAVFVADLTPNAGLAGLQHDWPGVFRPDGFPQLARGPLGPARGGVRSIPPRGPLRDAFDDARAVLVVTQVDPVLGADELATWATRVVYLVSAGSCSAEKLRSTADLVASAGLKSEFVILLGADASDESTGYPDGSSHGAERRGA